VFNATFNNISVILWQSDLSVEETGVPGVPGENHHIRKGLLTLYCLWQWSNKCHQKECYN